MAAASGAGWAMHRRLVSPEGPAGCQWGWLLGLATPSGTAILYAVGAPRPLDDRDWRLARALCAVPAGLSLVGLWTRRSDQDIDPERCVRASAAALLRPAAPSHPPPDDETPPLVMGIAYPSEEQAIRGVKPAAFSARRDEPRTWTRVSPADLAAAARPADALDGVVRQRCALVRVRHSRVVVPHEALLKATGSRLSCAEALAVPSRPREGGWLRRFEGEVGGALRAAVGPQQPSTLRGPGGLEVGVDCEVDLPGEGPRGRCEGGVLVSLDLLAWTPRGAAASDAAARAITAGLARQMDDACCALLQATGHKARAPRAAGRGIGRVLACVAWLAHVAAGLLRALLQLVGLAQPRGGAQQLPRAIAALHFAMREDAAAPSVGVVTGAFWLPGRAESPDEVAGEDGDALHALRKDLHRRAGAAASAPRFRLSQALVSSSAAPWGRAAGPAACDALLDIHCDAPQPRRFRAAGASPPREVQGSYLYLHYNCGGVDDRGWGCAYRSLQTLWSWYLLNHYTRRPVPTHREIQRMLVRLGDKPPAFEGSREWIGAVELSYVLQAELGVTCKILHAASGRDVPGLARELCAHFREHGTPCMVGGGVLAYTLLGAQWDSATPRGGSLLVLDPHWGAVDPGRRGAAVAGGWVAWRQGGDRCAAGNGPLFEPSCFYNILCPQRPSGP